MNKSLPHKLKYSFLNVFTGSDLSERKMPLMVAESRNDGPVVWLTGCIHGDEVAGMVVIQEIFKRLQKEPLLKGSIHALPLVNPFGFEMASRKISLTEEDLNRAFPGEKKGSLARRVADKIFNLIVNTKPAIVLDLHNDWISSIPYTLLDPRKIFPNSEVFEKTKIFAEKIGFPMVIDSNDPKDVAESLTTLSGSLVHYGIPSITLELGEPNIVNEKNVADGVRAVWRVLAELGMVREMNETLNTVFSNELHGKLLDISAGASCTVMGIIRFLVRPGSVVKKDQPIARIYNAFGKLRETLVSPGDGIVLSYTDYAVTYPGSYVIAYGLK